MVQNALDVAAKSRTTVCIAHRLSTIKDADNIIVVSRGEIVEQGTHDHLIALGGVYKGLVEAQRISADQIEGIEKAVAEGEEEEEEIINDLADFIENDFIYPSSIQVNFFLQYVKLCEIMDLVLLRNYSISPKAQPRGGATADKLKRRSYASNGRHDQGR